jgi:hypothetical protein
MDFQSNTIKELHNYVVGTLQFLDPNNSTDWGSHFLKKEQRVKNRKYHTD